MKTETRKCPSCGGRGALECKESMTGVRTCTKCWGTGAEKGEPPAGSLDQMVSQPVEVYWGCVWMRPFRCVQMDDKTVKAEVVTRKGASEMVRFRNTRKHKSWRLANDPSSETPPR